MELTESLESLGLVACTCPAHRTRYSMGLACLRGARQAERAGDWNIAAMEYAAAIELAGHLTPWMYRVLAAREAHCERLGAAAGDMSA